MHTLFNYIPKQSILDVDDYRGEERLHTFTDVGFRTQPSSQHGFFTPIGVINGKIISITNKQTSFLINEYSHDIGDWYSRELIDTYNALQRGSLTPINETLFYFVDYDCANGWAHSFDHMIHLAYIYVKWNLSCKLLVIRCDNVYYNQTLALLSKYLGFNYVYAEPNTNYSLRRVICTRAYSNILFPHVKEFMNERIIDPIMKVYEGTPYFDSICRLKYHNPNNIDRLATSFQRSIKFEEYCKENSVKDVSDIHDDELRIYLFNKANKITVCWGSAFMINIMYYVKSVDEKYINVLFHRNSMLERVYLRNEANGYCMNINTAPNFLDQLYCTFRFKGKVYDNLDTLEDLQLM